MSDHLQLKAIDTAAAERIHALSLDAFSRTHARDPLMRQLGAAYERFVEPGAVALVAAAQIAAALLTVFGA
ncbi:MAG: hypothetical protein IT381_31175 [Deltaproteobacteria bacterium]|nr:hypothetical protein [Deltaproteobacteria bacterium]